MQAIDWKTAMINGGKKLSDANAVDASLRAEIQGGEGHGDTAFHRTAKRESREIAHIDTVFVELVGACAAQAALAENLIIQSDFRSGICSDSLQFAAGESTFAAQIYFSGRSHRRTQYVSEIHEIDPAAVAILPLR